MSFLAPLFLAGAAGIALPVIFHLIRRSTRQRTLFSSLLLLQPSPPRLRRRSRLEDLILLALRCLVLLLLALGFARPYFRSPVFAPPAPAANQRVVILVDASASMQREGLWNAAVTRAENQARSLGPGDQLSLMTFSHDAQTLVTFDAWNAAPADRRPALVTGRLRETGAGWGDTRLAHALINAAESLTERSEDTPGLVRRVVLISDFQEGSRLEQLQAYEWPRAIALTVDRLASPNRGGNAGIQILSDANSQPGASNAVVRVRVANTADATQPRLEVGWSRANAPGFIGAPQELHIPPGATHTLALAVPAEAGLDRIILRGDPESFDNTAFVVPPTVSRRQIVHVGDDPGDDPKQPLFFLRRAFPGTNRVGISVVGRRGSETLGAADASAPLLVATDALPPAQADALHEAALRGGTVLITLRSAGEAVGATLGRVLGRAAVPITEVTPRNYAMLTELDFRHPLLAAFADPRFSDFTKIHFWHHRRLDAAAVEGARVIARFDSGDPAWLEVPVGRGRVFVFASGWQPEDSQLAVSSKFVPLLYAMIESGGTPLSDAPQAYTVGDVIPLSVPVGGAAQIRLPDGKQLPLAAGTTNFAGTDRPGIYTVSTTDGGPTWRYAVNVDPSESRTLPLALDELENLGVSIREPAPDLTRTPERLAELAAAEVENRQKIWRWVLVAALAFVFMESALSGWMSRRLAGGPDTAEAQATSTAATA